MNDGRGVWARNNPAGPAAAVHPITEDDLIEIEADVVTDADHEEVSRLVGGRPIHTAGQHVYVVVRDDPDKDLLRATLEHAVIAHRTKAWLRSPTAKKEQAPFPRSVPLAPQPVVDPPDVTPFGLPRKTDD